MADEEKAHCGKKLERLAMMPDSVVNVVMEVIDSEQKAISSETGVGPVEGGATPSVGASGQDTGGCGEAGEGSDRGL